MAQKLFYLGIFAYLDDVMSVLHETKKAGMKVDTIFSPIPSHEINEALGLKPSPVRYFTLFGGILGIVAGLCLAIYASTQWSFVVGGRPVIAWVPFVVVGFELCILFAVLSTVAGLLINTRLPKLKVPDHYDPRFTVDRFGVLILCSETEQENVIKVLKKCGVEEVHEVRK
jgi:molybdopterin-containing oxidoreductase family membrane subunit